MVLVFKMFLSYCDERVSENANKRYMVECFSSVQFSRSVVSDSLRPHGLLHARLPYPSLSSRVCSNSCPLNQWDPTISSSVTPSPPAISLSQHQVTLLILIQRNKLCNVERDLSTSFYRRGSGNSKRLGEKLKFGLKWGLGTFLVVQWWFLLSVYGTWVQLRAGMAKLKKRGF